MDSLTFQPILVATGCADEEGLLVMKDGRLVALLVRLADPAHGADCGRWFLEASFGQGNEAAGFIFSDLAEASTWLSDWLTPASDHQT